MKCVFRTCLSSLVMLLTITPIFAADEKKGEAKKDAPKQVEATEGAPKKEAAPKAERKPDGDRKPSAETPRGERKPEAGAERKPEAGAERRPARDGGGRRSEFPEEIKLTDEQLKKLEALRTDAGGKFTALSEKRDAVLTDAQKAARAEVEKKLREGGMSRQEYADAMAAALKLTDEQKPKMEAIEAEANQMRRDAETARMAVLTDDQKLTLRKLMAARELERMFMLPPDFTTTDEQKAGLKKLQDEHAAELKTLTEKRDSIMTPERRTALEAVFKDARENNKDRQALAEAMNAALNLTDAEKTELNETQQKLGELNRKINDAKLALLTPEQKAEFEKRLGSRGR
jgi:Spy/CpxP family protein refolding chaperone